jgi:hypothetical protein
MTEHLTREQIENLFDVLQNTLRHDGNTVHLPELKKAKQMALAWLEVQPRLLEWHGADTPPPVPEGGLRYFLVVTEKSKTAFGAYYLNHHRLHLEEECPDATKENNWASCKACQDGDGHRFTGWFEEKAEKNDEEYYFAMDADGPHRVVMWANPPANPIPTPEKTP